MEAAKVTTQSQSEYLQELVTPAKRPGYEAVKRAFDIICSALAIIILSPLMLIIALLIRLEDGGPALFVQTRIGKDRKPFKMYKFRSMHIGAEEQLEDLQNQNEASGPAFKIKEDPRITKIGHFVRITSIDELPQLLNVLKNEMSIVGPRPPLECEVAQYKPEYLQRLSVKPGLTCYWQCSGRNNLSFEEWMRLDIKYIHERGIWTDLKLILKTIPAVFKQDGAW